MRQQKMKGHANQLEAEKMSSSVKKQGSEIDDHDLFNVTMKKDWKEVARIYGTYPDAPRAKLTKSKETALHIAVSSYHADQADAVERVEIVRQMVESIPDDQVVEVLMLENDKGDTPLHLAAALGSEPLCRCIAEKDIDVSKRNQKGETPLFLAAHHGKIQAFAVLRKLYNAKPEGKESDDTLCRREDGDTILHSTISGEYFELADMIINYYPKLVNSVNEDGFSPLHILARKPNVFMSSSNLRLFDRFIYRCVIVHELKKTSDPVSNKISPCCRNGTYYPENYQTCMNFFSLPWAAFRVIVPPGKDCGIADEENPNEEDEDYDNREKLYRLVKSWNRKQKNITASDYLVDHGSVVFLACLTLSNANLNEAGKGSKKKSSFPPNYATGILLLKFLLNVLLTIFGIGIWRVSKIRGKKERHRWGVQIMTKLIHKESGYKYDHNGQTPTRELEPRYKERAVPPSMPPQDPDSHSTTEENASERKVQHKEGEHESQPETGVTAEVGKKSETVAETKNVKELTPVLATKMGITKMVKWILETFSLALQDLDEDEKNALVLAGKTLTNIAETGTIAQTKNVKKFTPVLLAAKMGITEMVKMILETFPVAIQDLDVNEKNALLLAVENRQIEVLNLLMKMKPPEFVLYQVDDKGNSALHLAAMFQKHQPWRIPGAALQMQWEIKWYKHVKKTMPAQCHIQYNKKGETAGEIFRKAHEKLVKDGSEWLIKTSESCSLVAALIATVAFATSSTVPGGVDQTTGHPVLENQPAFLVFSVASIVALCVSITALVFFLSILTSRCQSQDFRYDLPRKLLFGLTSLFTSIAAMLISFCAGHFFLVQDQLQSAAFPIYTVACLPITFFAFAQLSLYFDLVWSITRKVPLRSYKVFYN